MGDSVFDKERKRRNKEINRRLAMVKQKLWLVDTKTGNKILFAEAMGMDWYIVDMDEFGTKIDDWITGRDHDAAHGTEPTALILKTEGVND
jgi:hypothetical protein